MAKAEIITQLIDELGVKLWKFEQLIEAGNGTLRTAIENKKDISEKIIEKILRKYPRVNPEWLKSGEGSMFIETEETVIRTKGAVDYKDKYIQSLEERIKEVNRAMEIITRQAEAITSMISINQKVDQMNISLVILDTRQKSLFAMAKTDLSFGAKHLSLVTSESAEIWQQRMDKETASWLEADAETSSA